MNKFHVTNYFSKKFNDFQKRINVKKLLQIKNNKIAQKNILKKYILYTCYIQNHVFYFSPLKRPKNKAILNKNNCLLKYKKRLIQNFIRQNWEDFWKL